MKMSKKLFKISKIKPKPKDNLLDNNNNTINNLPINISIYNFYRRIINNNNYNEIHQYIKKYIELINESKLKNEIYYLLLLLINIRDSNNINEQKFYYCLLKEIIFDYQSIIFSLILKYKPKYGNLINIVNIFNDCVLDNVVLDKFKLLLNLMDNIDDQINIDKERNIDKENISDKNILKKNKIFNNIDFIQYLKKSISEDDLEQIKTILSISNEGVYRH